MFLRLKTHKSNDFATFSLPFDLIMFYRSHSNFVYPDILWLGEKYDHRSF